MTCKLIKLAVALFFVPVLLSAQSVSKHHVTGNIIDRDTKEGVSMASIAITNLKDSSFVAGVITDSIGHFRIPMSDGNYQLKVTSVAYQTLLKDFTVNGEDLNMGNLVFNSDAVMLKEAVVTGQAAKLTVVEDTFVYNAAAYHTPEGSVVEELVKRLPGAQVDESGKITINGKTVKKIKIDGKEFMTGDTETAMKNLPVSIIERIRAYDEKSDLSRVTGIDDGQEETVLDFGIKRGMNKGTMSNFDLAAGTKDRYAGRGMVGYMKDNLRVMSFLNANNIGDRGFGRGGGGGGLNTNKMVGTMINYQGTKLNVNGNIRWNHRNSDNWSQSSSESFVSTNPSFTNSISQSYSRSNSWNANMRLEWTPDSMTNIMFRPNIRISSNDGRSGSVNATFNQNPYDFVEKVLVDETVDPTLYDEGIVVNERKSNSLSYSDNNSYNGMLQYNRRFGSKGRNLTLRADASYSESESKSSSLQDVNLALQDSTYITTRFNTTPTKNYSYTLRTTYSEPIAKALFLQFSYSFKYGKSKSDRSTYNYDNMDIFHGWTPRYRDWDDFLGRVEDPLSTKYYDSDLSKSSEYDTYTHNAQVMIRKQTADYNFSAGIMMEPQSSEFKYKYMSIDTIVKRSVLNFSPSLDFRYRFNKQTQLRAQYNGTTSQPSMTDMLDITDDSDPLNISKGNPGLKPSFTQSFNVHYNTYFRSHMQSINTYAMASMTSNSISNSVEYNDATGGRISRPENINGNWNANAGFSYSASIDTVGVWNINTNTNFGYQNHVAYLYRDQVTRKNYTKQTTISERLALSYRSSWIDIEPNGNVTYNHSTNKLQPTANLDTWQFSYGVNFTITCPWGTSISTDAGMSSRRGYSEASMNTNEFLWNGQVAHSFLKGKPLTVSLQFYDILHNQSTISRTISALQRSDSEHNSINSYAMLHVIFRFNSFGGKAARASSGGGAEPRPNMNDERLRGNNPPRGERPSGGYGGGGFGGGGRF